MRLAQTPTYLVERGVDTIATVRKPGGPRKAIAKEEEIYLPLIDSALTEEEGARLFTRLTEETHRLSEG